MPGSSLKVRPAASLGSRTCCGRSAAQTRLVLGRSDLEGLRSRPPGLSSMWKRNARDRLHHQPALTDRRSPPPWQPTLFEIRPCGARGAEKKESCRLVICAQALTRPWASAPHTGRTRVRLPGRRAARAAGSALPPRPTSPGRIAGIPNSKFLSLILYPLSLVPRRGRGPPPPSGSSRRSPRRRASVALHP